jgi:hypothetical protein
METWFDSKSSRFVGVDEPITEQYAFVCWQAKVGESADFFQDSLRRLFKDDEIFAGQVVVEEPSAPLASDVKKVRFSLPSGEGRITYWVALISFSKRYPRFRHDFYLRGHIAFGANIAGLVKPIVPFTIEVPLWTILESEKHEWCILRTRFIRRRCVYEDNGFKMKPFGKLSFVEDKLCGAGGHGPELVMLSDLQERLRAVEEHLSIATDRIERLEQFLFPVID